MSESADKAVEQSRLLELARVLNYEEQLRIAKRIVRAMNAAGIDCELAEAATAH